MKSKVRIQLLSKEGIPESDRLVDQYTEFLNGPKEKHEGIIKIEMTLTNSEDIEKGIEYLQQLGGSLPLKEVQKRGRKPLEGTPAKVEDKREDILKEAMLDKNQKDQEVFINFLRAQCNFVLMTEEHLEEMGIDLNLKKAHKGKYQWFMRMLRLAKDPKNDKIDPNLAFGMSVIGEPTEKVLIYKFKEYDSKMSIPLPEKNFVFKKQAILKFPKFMGPDERLKFRKEHRELMSDPSKQRTKFYKRWAPDVKVPKELEIVDPS